MLMARGKMGERVSEDAQLKLTDLVVDYGYKASRQALYPALGAVVKAGCVKETNGFWMAKWDQIWGPGFELSRS